MAAPATGIRVLVTDADERAALAATRSLGRAGHAVAVAGSRSRTVAGASRYCSGRFVGPDPLAAPEAYADFLAAAAREWRADVVLPVTDASLFAVLADVGKFDATRIPTPSFETVRRVADKQAVLAAARDIGIAVPHQVVLEAPGDAALQGAQGLRFPVVLKPSRSVAGAETARRKFGVMHVEAPGELAAALQHLDAAAFPVLAQERVQGPGIGVFFLVWDGHVVAQFAHRRIREKPPAGGVSVCCESITADPDLVERSLRLLQRFDWRGVAMVEYKVDQATGTPVLMEINGRFWGSLQLAIDAGVDFPRLLVDAALGRPVPAVPAYRVGQRSRWLWGDVDHALTRLRRSARDLHLPSDAPGRWRAIASCLLPWRPRQRGDVWRLDDPGPFVVETMHWLARR